MKFSRAITVAVKIYLVSFLLYLLGISVSFSGNLSVAIGVGLLLALFVLVITVYFILEEAEKISKEGTVDATHYYEATRDLQSRMVEISKKEGIQMECPKCGKRFSRYFQMCPECMERLVLKVE